MTFQLPETHLDRQGVLKNVVLGTKDIKVGPLWPVLALSEFRIQKFSLNFKWLLNRSTYKVWP